MVWYNNPMWRPGYKRFIEDYFSIVDKTGKRVPFHLNPIQNAYQEESTDRDVILKARQQGFSSLILARFAVDFLLKENSHSVVVADTAENAQSLLDRVKMFVESWEEKAGQKVPLKYNSRRELVNNGINSHYTIGTAGRVSFGRSKTITNLHFSEAAFYRDFEKMTAGAMQAVVPSGYIVIETTANGFNMFRKFWEEAERGEKNFTPLFYPGRKFYSQGYLLAEQKELGRSYPQEYPESPEEAFITSGECYFDMESLRDQLELAKVMKPLPTGLYA